MDIRLIMSDIDGCIIVKGKTPTLRQIEFFQAYGRRMRSGEVPSLVLCTGRGAEYVQPLSQVLGIMSEGEFPSIMENGSYLYYPSTRRMIRHPALAGKDSLIAAVKATLIRTLVDRGRGSIIPGKEGSVSLRPPDRITAFAFVSEVRAVLSGDMLDQVFISYSTAAVDVTVRGVDKGSALELFFRETGVPSASILMIGDSNNDLPIMGVAGYVACPKNATEAVKETVISCGGFVSDQEGTDGVIDIITRITNLGNPR